MEIHFLGTTGYHPNEQRDTMCIMIPELGIVFDAGTGFFRTRDLLVTDQLHVFLSHAHLDHVVGLTFLFDTLHQKQATVHVHGLADKLEAIEQHLFHPTLFPVRPPFQTHTLSGTAELGTIHPIEGLTNLVPGTRIEWFPLVHPGGAVGFRLTLPSGRRLAYVTDTTAALDAPYLEAIRGVELLIHECYFDDGAEAQAQLTGHSCLSPVLDLARQAEVHSLALVHLNPLTLWAPSPDRVSELAHGLDVIIPSDGTILSL